jgi:hypothetical protein
MTLKKEAIEQPKGYAYKYKRLYDLGSDRMGIIDAMLTKGDSTMSVAEKIQFEWNQCTSVKIGTLDKQLLRYRKDILEPRLIAAAKNAAEKSTSISKEIKAFNDQIDVIAQLNDFIAMQAARIKKAYTLEHGKKDGKLDPNINKELRPFTDMCRVLAGLQLETGVLRRVPKQVQGFFQQLSNEEVQEMRLEMTQNDDTLKSLNIIKDVLQEAASEIVDGEYIPVESESGAVSTDNGKDLEQESH